MMGLKHMLEIVMSSAQRWECIESQANDKNQ
jgi:hypothetical protein